MKPTLNIILTALVLASFAAAPTVRAQTPETGAESTKPKPKTGTASVEFGYRPDGMTMWDPWFVAHDGQVHLFHLQRLAPGSKRTAAEADHIGHATSRDLIQWTEQPLTVGPGEQGGIEDMQPWTGCAVVKDGLVLRADRSALHPKGDFVFALDAQDGGVFSASLPMFSPMNRRQFKVEPNRAYHLRLYARGDRYELYVDGELILHGGFPKEFVRKQPGLGLFVDRGETVIEKLAVYQQTPSPAKTDSK